MSLYPFQERSLPSLILKIYPSCHLTYPPKMTYRLPSVISYLSIVSTPQHHDFIIALRLWLVVFFLFFLCLGNLVTYTHIRIITYVIVQIYLCMSLKTVLHPSFSPSSNKSAGIKFHKSTTVICQLRQNWSSVRKFRGL